MDNEVYKIIDNTLERLNKDRSGIGASFHLLGAFGSQAKDLMVEHKLINFASPDHRKSLAYISTNGEDVLASGGFEKWMLPKNLKNNLKEGLELEKLVREVDKLKLDISLATGAKSRANASIIIAGVSALLALIALVLSLSK